jgi:hypothetical protein
MRETKIKDPEKRKKDCEATDKASFRYAKLNPSVSSAKASRAVLLLKASLFCQKQAYARRSGVEGFENVLQDG